jgi:hypothetical protein
LHAVEERDEDNRHNRAGERAGDACERFRVHHAGEWLRDDVNGHERPAGLRKIEAERDMEREHRRAKCLERIEGVGVLEEVKKPRARLAERGGNRGDARKRQAGCGRTRRRGRTQEVVGAGRNICGACWHEFGGDLVVW